MNHPSLSPLKRVMPQTERCDMHLVPHLTESTKHNSHNYTPKPLEPTRLPHKRICSSSKEN